MRIPGALQTRLEIAIAEEASDINYHFESAEWALDAHFTVDNIINAIFETTDIREYIIKDTAKRAHCQAEKVNGKWMFTRK